jgi:hypothetical protein
LPRVSQINTSESINTRLAAVAVFAELVI